MTRWSRCLFLGGVLLLGQAPGQAADTKTAPSASPSPSPLPTVRDLALQLGMATARQQMTACAAAHPAEAARFTEVLGTVRPRLERALDGLRERQADDLAQKVPVSLAGFVMQTTDPAALGEMASPLRGSCLRSLQEIEAMDGPEGQAFLAGIVKDLAQGSRIQLQETDRVLRAPPAAKP